MTREQEELQIWRDFAVELKEYLAAHFDPKGPVIAYLIEKYEEKAKEIYK